MYEGCDSLIGDYCEMYKLCSICGRLKYHTRFASNGRDKSRRKSYCHECKYFKRKGSKDIFNTQLLGEATIRIGLKFKTKRRVFYTVPYEDAVRMVEERTAGIVNSTLIHLFNTKVTFKEMVLKKDGYVCKYCNGFGNTIDHVVPISKGGKTTFSNCVCACENCNKEKGNLSVEEFMNIKKNKVKKILKSFKNIRM